MRPTMYLTFGLGLLAAVGMSVPAYPAAPTAGAVGSRPTSAEGLVKLAYFFEDPPFEGPFLRDVCPAYDSSHCDPADGAS